MAKTITTRYDVAEYLRTPQKMAAYLEACLEEANGDAAFIASYIGTACSTRFISINIKKTFILIKMITLAKIIKITI